MAISANERETAPVLNEHVTTLVSDRGKTTIDDGVVAKIAALAAREVEGVHALVSKGLGQTVAGLARAVTRQQQQAQQATGVAVEVGEREAIVSVRVSLNYGANIPAVAAAVRNNIADRVETMTGLVAKEVNVAVVDLYFPEEEAEPVRRVE